MSSQKIHNFSHLGESADVTKIKPLKKTIIGLVEIVLVVYDSLEIPFEIEVTGSQYRINSRKAHVVRRRLTP